MSESKTSEIETKYDLLIALASGTGTREFQSMPRRPMSYEEIQDIEREYSDSNGNCEAWILDLLDIDVGGVNVTMGDEELDKSEAVINFAFLVGGTWLPFGFEEGAWYQRDKIPHPDDIDLDEELELGSMKRVGVLRED